MAEHVWAYYMARLKTVDYLSKYDAVERDLYKGWHIGAYYMRKLMNLMGEMKS